MFNEDNTSFDVGFGEVVTVGGLTPEQEAEINANTEARHTHANKNTLDTLGCQALDTPITDGDFNFDNGGVDWHRLKFGGDTILMTSDGAVVRNIETKEENGKKFFRLYFNRPGLVASGNGDIPNFVDIPIDGTNEKFDFGFNGTELVLPSGGTGSEGGGSVTVDPTLSIEGAVAEAKATGDRLSNVEYQTVTTDSAYEHKNLPEIEKSVTFETDGVFGDKAYINYGVDLLPRGGFNRSFPWIGLTATQKGDIYKLTGEVTGGMSLYLTKDGSNNYYTELPEGLTGKTLTLLGFTNVLTGSLLVQVQFYDASKMQILKKATNLAKTTTTCKLSFEIPEGTVYYAFSFYTTASVVDCETKLYLLVGDFEEISLSDSTTKDNITSGTFSTLPYKSYVQYKVSLNEFISNFAGGGTVSYIAPEDFGAKGDGETDDSEAIARCIEEAYTTKQIVLMAKKYYTTAPIVISGNGINIIANDIVYDGTDVALKISGQNNSIKIHSITSGGVGIGYRGDNNKIVRHNDVDINSVYSSSHGIVFYNGLKGIYQNTVKFNLIRAGGTGAYGICSLDIEGDSWVTENNFYGGQISNCEWAVYKIAGNSKCYGLQIEEEVQGGFYITGAITIFQPRYAEAQRDGNLPIIKIINPTGVTLYGNSDSSININQLDLSEVNETFTTPDGKTHYSLERMLGVIDNTPIIPKLPNDGENISNTMVYTNKAYIWGKHLIFTPHIPFKKVVTTETFDTRLIGNKVGFAEISEMTQLPTKFVVDNINTEIYLHSSYCVFGYNEFEVIQANGFTCKVYDVNGTLIFDGTTQGDGLYKFNVYKDSEYCVSKSGGQICADFLGHYWNVENLTAYKPMREVETIASDTNTLLPNVKYNFGEVSALTVEFDEANTSNRSEYSFTFTSGATPTVLTLPSSVQWANELTVEANKRYEISVVDNIGLWCAVDLVVSE